MRRHTRPIRLTSLLHTETSPFYPKVRLRGLPLSVNKLKCDEVQNSLTSMFITSADRSTAGQ